MPVWQGASQDSRGAASALHFVLVSSAKHDINSATLLVEMQQLGLPAPSAEMLVSTFAASEAAIVDCLKQRALRVGPLGSVPLPHLAKSEETTLLGFP